MTRQELREAGYGVIVQGQARAITLHGMPITVLGRRWFYCASLSEVLEIAQHHFVVARGDLARAARKAREG